MADIKYNMIVELPYNEQVVRFEVGVVTAPVEMPTSVFTDYATEMVKGIIGAKMFKTVSDRGAIKFKKLS